MTAAAELSAFFVRWRRPAAVPPGRDHTLRRRHGSAFHYRAAWFQCVPWDHESADLESPPLRGPIVSRTKRPGWRAMPQKEATSSMKRP